MRLTGADLGDAAHLTEDLETYSSGLPSETELASSWVEGGGYFDLGSPAASALGEAMWANSVHAYRATTAIASRSVGVLGVDMPELGALLTPSLGVETVAGWAGAVAGHVAAEVMDRISDAMGGVPILGAVAKGIIMLQQLLVARLSRHAPRPAIVTYNKAEDGYAAAQAQQILASQDWTDLFLPRFSGAWHSVQLDNGRGYEGSTKHPDRLGAWPGGWGGSRRPQGSTYWGLPNGCGLGVDGKLSDLEKCFRYTLVPSGVVADNVGDTYDAYPSTQAFASAAWAAVGGRRTAAMYSIDTRRLRSWQDYYAGLRERAMWDSVEPAGGVSTAWTKTWRGGRSAWWRTYAHGYRFDDVQSEVPFTDGHGYAIEDVIAQYVADLKRRQRRSLSTLLCAYCSSKQAAFRAPLLARQLRNNRRKLLMHPARREVSLADVVDLDYRQEMAAAQMLGATDFATNSHHDWGLEGVPPPVGGGGSAEADDGDGGVAGLLIAGVGLMLARRR